MISACARAGVRLAVAYYRRWYPKTRRMKDLLAGGAIGKVISIQVCLMSRYDPSPDDPKHWRVEMAPAGGGALMDVGSHRLDVVCSLFGLPQSVAGFADRVEMAYEVPDSESLVARYASGAHLCGAFSWCSAERRDDMVIYGTRGALLASPFDGPTLALENEAGREEFSLPPHDNVHYPLIDSFAGRLARGQPPEFDGNDGLAATRIIEACYQSARTGSVAALARSSTPGRAGLPRRH
jgi:predicted dehydrogenase